MRFLAFASCLLCAVPLVLAQASKEPFEDSLKEYVRMSRRVEQASSAQKPTKETEQIANRQQQLAAAIVNARRDARQGDLFIPAVTAQFRKIIQKAFKEPGAKEIRKTIEERDPVKAIVLKVNEVYPDDQPRTTMPPTLLKRLPDLPKELAYRVIGTALVLLDTRTNLIVDFIPNAIP